MSEMDKNLPVEEEEMDDNIITMLDENGDEVDFEFLDLIEYEGKNYVVLVPAEESEEADTVVILEAVEVEDDMEEYHSIADQELVDTIFEIFKEKNKDEFNFVD